MKKKIAVIIGAGPAGLTAALELLRRTDITPVLLEASDDVGGISRTFSYKGNRIDVGGHRFFTRSQRVLDWWFGLLPLARTEQRLSLQFQHKAQSISGDPTGPDPETTDEIMLVRPRQSRIYYDRKFFDYPISLSVSTLRKLGLVRVARIAASYVLALLFPIRPERSLEDFFINRFGGELYRTFFKDYTEKVWGEPCTAISPDWGRQRIKGLSITKAVLHALRLERRVETSQIERFLYPKHGPGQMWEKAATEIRARGGIIMLNHKVVGMNVNASAVKLVRAQERESGNDAAIECDYVFSTMPMRDLAEQLKDFIPSDALRVARGLRYRDFLTVGLLLKRFAVGQDVPDNWIYIQEPGVRVGRLQIFNNWSPAMAADASTVWVGLEYFCNVGDDLWSMTDQMLVELAKKELAAIGLASEQDVIDGTVIRMPKAYPAYTGTFAEFPVIRAAFDAIPNLFLIGRNGMHRYNNQDHSMLTAMAAVDSILAGTDSKDAIWNVNTEDAYHETGTAE